MSAFPFTAPYISKEDEMREIEELTDKELAELKDDLYGNTAGREKALTMPEASYVVGTRLVEEAILSMDDSTKRAYARALKTAPHLLDSESPIRSFLYYTRFDVWKAAELIVNYWSQRLAVFGSDRAFLPMTMDGAMADDLDCLEQGIMMNAENDQNGRPVDFIDRIRMLTNNPSSRNMFLRVFFYLQQTRMKNPVGFVVLINTRGFDLYLHYDRIFTKRMLMILSVFPNEAKAVHCCIGSGKSVLDVVLPVHKYMFGKTLRKRVRLHSGGTSEMLYSLREYGMNQSHIDVVLGGLLKNPDVALRWVEQRREIERQQQTDQDVR